MPYPHGLLIAKLTMIVIVCQYILFCVYLQNCWNEEVKHTKEEVGIFMKKKK